MAALHRISKFMPSEKLTMKYLGIVVLTLFCTICRVVLADEIKLEQPTQILIIEHAYQPFISNAIASKVGYLTVRNNSSEPQRIVKAVSQDFESISIHQSVINDDLASMHSIDSLFLDPGQTVDLAPGGLHLMLYNSVRDQRVGDSSKIFFELENGVLVPFELKVVEP
jgi:copper(I)-binding protein